MVHSWRKMGGRTLSLTSIIATNRVAASPLKLYFSDRSAAISSRISLFHLVPRVCAQLARGWRPWRVCLHTCTRESQSRNRPTWRATRRWLQRSYQDHHLSVLFSRLVFPGRTTKKQLSRTHICPLPTPERLIRAILQVLSLLRLPTWTGLGGSVPAWTRGAS